MNYNDSRILISKYIKNITEKALKLLRDEYKDAQEGNREYLLKQVNICNEIIELLKNNLNEVEFEELKIDESEEILN